MTNTGSVCGSMLGNSNLTPFTSTWPEDFLVSADYRVASDAAMKNILLSETVPSNNGVTWQRNEVFVPALGSDQLGGKYVSVRYNGRFASSEWSEPAMMEAINASHVLCW